MSVVLSSVGVVSLGAMLLWMWRGLGVNVLLLSITQDGMRIRVWCAKGLAIWSVVWLPFIAVYYVSSNFYECGKPWLYSTIAYLHDAPEAEIVVALAACISVGLAAYGLRALEHHTKQVYPIPDHAYVISIRQQVVLWSVWIPVSLVLSVPMALYIFATVLPPHNILGLTGWVLESFRYAAAPMLYVISALLIPPLSRWVVGVVCGVRAARKAPRIAADLMMAARLVVSLLVPFVMTVVFNMDCHAAWLQLWKPCHTEGMFDTTLYLPWRAVLPSFPGYIPGLLTGNSTIPVINQ